MVLSALIVTLALTFLAPFAAPPGASSNHLRFVSCSYGHVTVKIAREP